MADNLAKRPILLAGIDYSRMARAGWEIQGREKTKARCRGGSYGELKLKMKVNFYD